MFDRGHPRAVEDERQQPPTPSRTLMSQHMHDPYVAGGGLIHTFGYPSTVGASAGLARTVGFPHAFPPVYSDSFYAGFPTMCSTRDAIFSPRDSAYSPRDAIYSLRDNMYSSQRNVYHPQDSYPIGPVGLGIRGDGVRGDKTYGDKTYGDNTRGDSMHRFSPSRSSYHQ
jgi:hypothetical protein